MQVTALDLGQPSALSLLQMSRSLCLAKCQAPRQVGSGLSAFTYSYFARIQCDG